MSDENDKAEEQDDEGFDEEAIRLRRRSFLVATLGTALAVCEEACKNPFALESTNRIDASVPAPCLGTSLPCLSPVVPQVCLSVAVPEQPDVVVQPPTPGPCLSPPVHPAACLRAVRPRPRPCLSAVIDDNPFKDTPEE